MEEQEFEESSESDRLLSYKRQCLSCSWAICMPMAFGYIRIRQILIQWDHIFLYYPPIFDLGTHLIMDLLSALLCSISLYILGRRRIVIFTNLLISFTVVLFILEPHVLINTMCIMLLCMSRQFFLVSMVVYVAETADPQMRPVLIGFYCVNEPVGYYITFMLMKLKMELTIIFVVIVTSGSVVMSFYAPETPYWLASTGALDESEEQFVYLRAGYSDMNEAYVMLNMAERDGVARQQGFLHNVRFSDIIVPLIIFWFMLMTNIMMLDIADAVLWQLEIYYQYYDLFTYQHFFQVSYWGIPLMKTMNALVTAIGSALFLVLCQIVPHRLLFMGSIILSLLVLLIYFIADYNPILSLYTISLSHLFVNLGGYQMLQIMPVEMFPSRIREFGVMICQVQTAFTLVIGKWPQLTHFEIWLNNFIINIRLFFFLVGLFFTILFMPETKGLTLAEAEEKSRKLWKTSFDSEWVADDA